MKIYSNQIVNLIKNLKNIFLLLFSSNLLLANQIEDQSSPLFQLESVTSSKDQPIDTSEKFDFSMSFPQMKVPSYIPQATFSGDKEIVIEIAGREVGQGDSFQLSHSLAFAEIIESVPHYHKYLKETYIVISGYLDVTLEGKIYHLSPGDALHIPPGTLHEAKCVGNTPAILFVPCVTAWTPNDMYLEGEMLSITQANSSELSNGDAFAPIFPTLYREKHSYPNRDVYVILNLREEENLPIGIAYVDILKPIEYASSTQTRTITVIGGEIEVTISDSSETRILEPGDFFEIPKELSYKIIPLSGYARVLITLLTPDSSSTTSVKDF